MELLSWLFLPGKFMPYGYCYMWAPGLLWLHVISDSLIFLACMTIPCALLHIVRRRKDLPFNWIFVCFVVFIVACGLTHAMEVWNIWHAMYWLAGLVKGVTAAASVLTAILLVQLAPQALNLPRVSDLHRVNETLTLQGAAVRASEVKFSGILESASDAMVIADVQEHKQVEEALRQSEERLSLLVQGAKDYAILMLDPEGRITAWSEAAESIEGYRAEEIIGKHFSKFYMPEAVANGEPSRGLKIAAEQGRFEEEGWRVRKDGSRFWASVVITALHNKTGRLRGFSKVTRDITEHKKSQEHLLKTLEELQHSNEELQQFAYVASHDLQEPLRMVASYTQLLAKRYKGRLDSDADEFIAYAVDGSSRMQALIQDLLAYSRAGTNGKALREISSEDALKEALTNLRAAIEESGAVVSHDSLPAITTDDTQLAQIFQNLVGNAIKYRRAEVPRVHVSARKGGGKEWIFSVRDNGLGIDPQYFERIFILFQRLHGRREFEGTGIGLAICKKMLERLGGRIWVESQPEKGSTFYFALPERDGK